jgi:hypothetical protein
VRAAPDAALSQEIHRDQYQVRRVAVDDGDTARRHCAACRLRVESADADDHDGTDHHDVRAIADAAAIDDRYHHADPAIHPMMIVRGVDILQQPRPLRAAATVISAGEGHGIG